MRSSDLVPGCVGLALALGVGWGALRMPMGTLVDPGAGFLPFWVSIVLALMSVSLIARALRRRSRPPDAPSEDLDHRRMIGVLGGLALYGLLLEQVGFLAVTFLLLTGLARLLEAPGWRAAVVFGALATGGSFALFGLWLGVPLPKGFLLP
ncbi:MAG: tripartite tricarboxylate transporter TctB family protein [Candidatus Rokuibacteriota bacterium]